MSFEVERLEKIRDQQTRTESKAQFVEQIKLCLHSGDYSRALGLLQGGGAEVTDDAELSELREFAQDGVRRNTEANRLITESQELFAQQKSAEAIRLLREAYELDKKNSLARAILSNALVEHAHSVVETDWLEAESLTNQALVLNPAHPTGKTVRALVVQQKEKSTVEDWVAQARKRQSSGDLFAALAWVAEGLAVHPDDPKLLQIQNEIQRDQAARRRQARRGDVEELRRMGLEIDKATDAAAKEALAGRIQAMAAKYWTDGEVLSAANGLLRRMGLVPQEGATTPPHNKGAAVIFHVPRPTAPAASRRQNSQIKPSVEVTSQSSPGQVPVVKGPSTELESQLGAEHPAPVPAAEPSAPPAKVTSPSPQPGRPARSNATALVLVSAIAVVLFAAIFYFVRRHHAPSVAKTSDAAPTASVPAVTAPTIPEPAPIAPVQTTPEPPPPTSDTAGKMPPDDQLPAARNTGTLLVVTGQDNARVLLDGKLQSQLTQAGELRLRNLGLKDYVVQVSKPGFQDPPPQKVRIRRADQAQVIFNLQPLPSLQPRLASLNIQGGTPGSTVFVDMAQVGTIQPDGTLSVSTVSPGDHTVELRKERFKPRQFTKHFIVGAAVTLVATDAALEALPSELKILFAPGDAKVAIAKAGELPTMVSSGVPLNVAAGTYTLTARTAEGFTRSSTLEVIAGQSKTLDLPLAPSGMSKWDDPGAWKQEKDSFVRKGGDFVLYGVVPVSGTFAFSAMPTKGHLLQWVLNYVDAKNYVLCQVDDENFYRTVIRNGQKTNEIKIPDKGDKKSFRTLHIRVSPTEIVHQIRHGNSWTVLDRWTQPGANLSLGKFGFYLPGNDQVAISGFAHYADLNIR